MPRSFYARLHRHFGTTKSGYEQYKEAEQKLAELLERLPILSYIDRKANSTGKKVAVIGAGFAGLSAAYILKKAGFDVTVFESQNRIGGRVSSSNVSGSIPTEIKDKIDSSLAEKVIEYGAELIGANHLLWLFFARKFGLGINLMTTEEKFDLQGLKEPLYFEGRSILSDTWREIKSQMQKVIDKITQDANQIENPFEPWKTPGADILDNISVKDMLDIYVDDLIDEPLQKKIKEYLIFEFENNNLTDPAKQSYLGLLSSIKGGGGDDYWEQTELFRCANGNASLAEAFQKEIGDIQYKHILKEINIQEPLGIKLVFDGKEHDQKYEYVVLTIPTFNLGKIVIKKQNEEIKEEDKNELEEKYSTQSGNAFKYITALKKRFWLKSNLSPSGSHENLGMLWEATDNQSLSNNGQDKNDQNYVLTVFSGGKKANDIMYKNGVVNANNKKEENLITEQIKDYICNLYPEYRENSKAELLVDWNEIAGDGYSCPEIGEVITKAKRLNNSYAYESNEPYKDKIFFAGEHTCMAFFGYMEGALQSGVMAAQRIAKQEGRKFDGLMVFYGKEEYGEPSLILKVYHENDRKGKLCSDLPVNAKNSDRVERSDINRAVGIFFQNNVYFAWKGRGRDNYPNIVQASFENELREGMEVKLKFSKKYTKTGDKYRTKHTPALVLYSNQLFMGWTTESEGKIMLAPIEVKGNQIQVCEPVIIGKPVITGKQNPEQKTGENEFISNSEINFASYKHKLYVTWISKDRKLKIAESVDGKQFHKVRTILVFNKKKEEESQEFLLPKSVALEVYDGELYLAWIQPDCKEGKKDEIYIMTSKIEEGSTGLDFSFLDKIELPKAGSGLSMTIYNNRLYIAYTEVDKKIKIYRTKKDPSKPEDKNSYWFEQVPILAPEVENEGALGLIGFALQGIYGGQKE